MPQHPPSPPSSGVSQSVASRRTVMRSVAWGVPVVTVAAAAPAFASSTAGTADITLNSTPTTVGGNTKSYTFNIDVATGNQPITAVAIRFSLDPAYAASYDTNSANQPAPPAGWSRTTLTSSSITFTYNTSPVPTPFSTDAIFSLVRQNNPSTSRVTIEVLVTSGGTTAVTDTITVTFNNGVATVA